MLKPIATWNFDAGDHVAGLAWLPDGQHLAVAPSEGKLAILDRATGTPRFTFPGHAGGNSAISASSREPWLATGGHDGKVRVWDCETGLLIRELSFHDPRAPHLSTLNPQLSTSATATAPAPAWIEHIAYSPDGTLLAATAGRTLRVWDAAGVLQMDYPGHASTVAALAWRPDSRGLGTGCYLGAQLFRLGEAQPYEELRWKGSLISLAWSPSGRYVAGGSQEATIQFWKLPYREGDELFMSGYETKVRELAWDRESRYLASGGGEVIMVWDVSGKGPAGRTPLQLAGHEGKVTCLQFQNAGPKLASGGVDGRVIIWDLQKSTRHERRLSPPRAHRRPRLEPG